MGDIRKELQFKMVYLLNLLFFEFAYLDFMLHPHFIPQEAEYETEDSGKNNTVDTVGPPRQPGRRKNTDFQGSLRTSPYSVFIRSFQMKKIAAGRQIIVSGEMALGVYYDFFIVIAFQTVGVHILLRFHIIQKRKLNGKIIIPMSKGDLIRIIHVF